MAVWTLETDTYFTSFYFPLEEDKAFFHELAKNYFEESKLISEKWRPLFMVRNEPMKHPDFFTVDESDVIALSQRAVDCLKDFLKEGFELLPIETDAGRYYALNVLNFVDCLDKAGSEYDSTKQGIIVKYSALQFDENKLGQNIMFKLKEMPHQVFITDYIEEQCIRESLNGLLFDDEINLAWYPE